ncbi:MAG TPA: hypothetical protein DCX06_12390 [Opitutae bacterium]|nr:hypothetical protein [Opitutae bacterium]
MAKYRSYLFPEATVGDGFVFLDARESHHLVRVFRAKIGDSVEVLDGLGKRYLGEIEIADAKAVKIAVQEVLDTSRERLRVTLMQSVPKGKTMDLILRMATEIGVALVQPVFTDQGDVQIKGERLSTKVEKWRLTMIESCKQCGLSYLPCLNDPMYLSNWLKENEPEDGCLRVVASLEAGSQPLLDVLRSVGSVGSVVVAVGPEGDFTPLEYAELKKCGFRSVRLGANVLRSETAAAYILSVVDQFAQR